MHFEVKMTGAATIILTNFTTSVNYENYRCKCFVETSVHTRVYHAISNKSGPNFCAHCMLQATVPLHSVTVILSCWHRIEWDKNRNKFSCPSLPYALQIVCFTALCRRLQSFSSRFRSKAESSYSLPTSSIRSDIQHTLPSIPRKNMTHVIFIMPYSDGRPHQVCTRDSSRLIGLSNRPMAPWKSCFG